VITTAAAKVAAAGHGIAAMPTKEVPIMVVCPAGTVTFALPNLDVPD
jgi:hypothetical protein